MPLHSAVEEEGDDHGDGSGCFLLGASVLGLVVDSPHILFLIFSSTPRERYCPILQDVHIQAQKKCLVQGQSQNGNV